jgi:hypothetical protein
MKSNKREAKTTSSRTRRRRPVPGWIAKDRQLDEMARRRCLLILSVLSGETAVSDAIEQAKISRPLYYDLETRALRGMLLALSPHNSAAQQHKGHSGAQLIRELERRVQRLETDKRRLQRLLLLTRHVVKPGPLTTGAGRNKGKDRRSSRAGSKPSARSTKRMAQPRQAATPREPGEAGQ